MHFAIMGNIYSEKILGVKNPRVGLLNIGEEPSKGDELSIETHKLLEKSELNFIGNVEGRDIFDSVADVVVCDGFVGNVVLKVSERVLGLVVWELKNQMKNNPMSALGFLMMKPVFQGLKKRFDYAEYGGGPLLGINGTLIICHGGSNSRAIRNAIRAARLAILNDLNGNIARVVKTDKH
jgi:glycerol-3-phosphate acyltransferase PlsX